MMRVPPTFFKETSMASRRDFLGAAAAMPLLGATSGQAAQPARRVPVVDTHLHCFAGRDDKRFPYHERAPYRPEEVSSPEHLLRCMEGAGVDYAIVVHPEPYQDDHRYLEHCLQVGKGKLKGTALVFADRAGSAAQLPNLVKRLGVLAVRIHAYAPDRLPPFGRRELRDLWVQAADLGIAVQLHFEPRHAPGFQPYIKEFKNTRVLIDHLGRPFQGTPQEYATVLGFARYDNTVMKLSSIPTARQYPHRDVGPVLKQIVGAWGADRLMHAGGYGATATGESYRAERERLRTLLPNLSRADQDKILGGTAARLFRLGQ
jgi:predicted TIM-barrel fold metal-dependent hydrolase